MITSPTPAGALPACPVYSLRRFTTQNARIRTAVLVIGIEWVSVQIGGSARVAPGQGTLRSVKRSAPSP